ncbi:MAG: hemerythrin domain-containing protein [Sulfuricella sp.]|nr:hemerythrin domain-containing protein [Sulfuricella sp.]
MFEFLWKRKTPSPPSPKQADPAPQRVAPGTGVHFDPNLVAGLIADHRALVAIFGDIVTAAGARNQASLQEKLGDFGDALRGHLLTENIKFYVYLQHSLESNTESAAIMHEFRKEMQHIGKAVADFLHKYTATTAWSESVWASFETELAVIGKVLVKRIQTEENVLYALYLPPEEYR